MADVGAGAPSGSGGVVRMSAFTLFDANMMRRAIALARKGAMWVSPNPMVGAVIVQGTRIAGEGWHRRFGGPHAEVEALAAARGAARGATVYVTLEPCCHHGKTPPCTKALIGTGVAEVVVAMPDPFPEMKGKGLTELAVAGITVRTGLLEDEARALNRAYLTRLSAGRPLFVAKWAMSADGRVATHTGDSKYLTGEPARRRVHEIRSGSDGVLVGAETVLADDPILDSRLVNGRTPIAIVLDSTCRTPLDSQLVQRGERVIIATTSNAPEERRRALERAGCEVVALDSPDGRVDINALAQYLGAKPMNQVLVEGGPLVHASFFDAGLVDRALVFIAPVVIGGTDAPAAIGGAGVALVSDVLHLGAPKVDVIGDDVLMVFGTA